MQKKILDFKPNIIFHFASEIFDTHDKKKIYKTNVEGSKNIKKSAIKNNVENLIYSDGVVQMTNVDFREKNYILPDTKKGFKITITKE